MEFFLNNEIIFIFIVEIYLSPIETHCSNIDYFPSDLGSGGLDDADAITRMHLARSVIALFILSLLAVICAFFTGLSGCWKRSAGAITGDFFLIFCFKIIVILMF